MRQTGAWSEVEGNKLNSYELCGGSASKFWGFKRVFASFNVSMSFINVCVYVCVFCGADLHGAQVDIFLHYVNCNHPSLPLCPCARPTYAPYHPFMPTNGMIFTLRTRRALRLSSSPMQERGKVQEREIKVSHICILSLLHSWHWLASRALLHNPSAAADTFFSLFDFSTLHIRRVEPGAIAICRLIVVIRMQSERKAMRIRKFTFFPNFLP